MSGPKNTRDSMPALLQDSAPEEAAAEEEQQYPLVIAYDHVRKAVKIIDDEIGEGPELQALKQIEQDLLALLDEDEVAAAQDL